MARGSPVPELVVARDPPRVLSRLPAVPAERVQGAAERPGSPQGHPGRSLFLLLLLLIPGRAGLQDGHAAAPRGRDPRGDPPAEPWGDVEGLQGVGGLQDLGGLPVPLRAGRCGKGAWRGQGGPTQPRGEFWGVSAVFCPPPALPEQGGHSRFSFPAVSPRRRRRVPNPPRGGRDSQPPPRRSSPGYSLNSQEFGRDESGWEWE